MKRGRGPILVTGAGGFIGGAVARHLAEEGRSVRGATRDGRALGAGIANCALDVTKAESLPAPLAGADTVVHCAYGDRAATVVGTRLLLEAAQAAGVRRVVHLSSIAVYGSASGVVNEAAPLLPPHGRGYAHWKAATEASCWAMTGMETVVLRPAIVYGRGSAQWVEQPKRRLLSGRWGDLGAAGRGTANLVHVSDVARACAAALDAPDAAGEAFNIAGGEAPSWRDWYRMLGDALGVGPLPAMPDSAWRRRALIGLPLRAAARALPPLAPLLRARILLSPSPSELRLFALGARYPTEKASQLLGWQPRMGLEQGVQESLGLALAS